jgi:hypothetical protein
VPDFLGLIPVNKQNALGLSMKSIVKLAALGLPGLTKDLTELPLRTLKVFAGLSKT